MNKPAYMQPYLINIKPIKFKTFFEITKKNQMLKLRCLNLYFIVQKMRLH